MMSLGSSAFFWFCSGRPELEVSGLPTYWDEYELLFIYWQADGSVLFFRTFMDLQNQERSICDSVEPVLLLDTAEMQLTSD